MISLIVAALLPSGAAKAAMLMVAGVVMLIAAGLILRRLVRGGWPGKAGGRTGATD